MNICNIKGENRKEWNWRPYNLGFHEYGNWIPLQCIKF